MRSPKWQIGLAGLLMSAVTVGAAFADEQAGLKQATDAIRRGNFSQAVQLLTTELEAQNRSVDERARTFYYRAKAYAGLKQPGRARADLNAALWLGKLPAGEAAEAGRLKTQLEASDAAGEETVAVTPAPPKPPEPAKSEPPPKARAAAPQPAPPTSFATTVAATPPPPPPPPRTEVSREKAAAPSWSQQSVSRAALPEPKPSPFIKTSPAFAAAAAQQRAATPQASEVVTGALPPARAANSSTNQSPAATHWETDVAATPPPPVRSAPQVAAAQPTPPAAAMPAPQATRAPTMAPAAPVMAPAPAAQATSLPAPTAQSAQTSSSFGLSQNTSPPADAQDTSQASSVPLIGWMFEKSSSPYDKRIADADDFQRRYVEKIRRYNQERQAATTGTQQ